MTISTDDERLNIRAAVVSVTDDRLIVELEDGRTITAPLEWYPRLLNGTPKERAVIEMGHFGIHWPELDEDLSICGLLLGHKSGESQKSLSKWLELRRSGKRPSVKVLPLPEWAKMSSKAKVKLKRPARPSPR